MVYEGIAVMYMNMPMCAQPLPIMGQCTVNEKKISLRFPLTNVSFDLPSAPTEGGADMDFKMAGPKGDMTLRISYKADMSGFLGSGVQDGSKVISFAFSKPGTGLQNLKNL